MTRTSVLVALVLIGGCHQPTGPRAWELVSRELVSAPGFQLKLVENSAQALVFAIAVEENTDGSETCASPVTRLRTVDDEANGIVSARFDWSRRGCANPETAVYTIRLKNRGAPRERFGVKWRRSPSYCLLGLIERDQVTMVDVEGDCSAGLPVRAGAATAPP